MSKAKLANAYNTLKEECNFKFDDAGVDKAEVDRIITKYNAKDFSIPVSVEGIRTALEDMAKLSAKLALSEFSDLSNIKPTVNAGQKIVNDLRSAISQLLTQKPGSMDQMDKVTSLVLSYSLYLTAVIDSEDLGWVMKRAVKKILKIDLDAQRNKAVEDKSTFQSLLNTYTQDNKSLLEVSESNSSAAAAESSDVSVVEEDEEEFFDAEDNSVAESSDLSVAKEDEEVFFDADDGMSLLLEKIKASELAYASELEKLSTQNSFESNIDKIRNLMKAFSEKLEQYVFKLVPYSLKTFDDTYLCDLQGELKNTLNYIRSLSNLCKHFSNPKIAANKLQVEVQKQVADIHATYFMSENEVYQMLEDAFVACLNIIKNKKSDQIGDLAKEFSDKLAELKSQFPSSFSARIHEDCENMIKKVSDIITNKNIENTVDIQRVVSTALATVSNISERTIGPAEKLASLFKIIADFFSKLFSSKKLVAPSVAKNGMFSSTASADSVRAAKTAEDSQDAARILPRQ